MINKLFITSLLMFGLGLYANGQRIVVDSSSTKRYLITPSDSQPSQNVENQNQEEDPSFGDRAISIGLGIVNRLKARLNLDEAAESLKEKKDKILGKDEKEDGG